MGKADAIGYHDLIMTYYVRVWVYYGPSFRVYYGSRV